MKGVGSWHLRKKRMEIIVNEFPERGLVRERHEFSNEHAWNEYLERHAQFKVFKERLEDYDKYLAIKRQVNAKRRETQVLLTPTSTEEKFKSE